MGTDVRQMRRTGQTHGSYRGHGRGLKTRVQWRAVRLAFVALAVGILLGLLAPRLLAADRSASSSQRTHVVSAGETLWGLAGEYGDGGDRRQFVYEAVRLNGLESSGLYPGQRLILP